MDWLNWWIVAALIVVTLYVAVHCAAAPLPARRLTRQTVPSEC